MPVDWSKYPSDHKTPMKQLTLDRFFDFKSMCRHKSICATHAYVPTGIACLDCGKLLAQYIPESPEVLGYVSADWAWKHIHGEEWTTQ